MQISNFRDSTRTFGVITSTRLSSDLLEHVPEQEHLDDLIFYAKFSSNSDFLLVWMLHTLDLLNLLKA